MGYAVAKTFLGLYVDGRRAVCAVAGDSENVDLAVEIIYARAMRGGEDGDKCPTLEKTGVWKTTMNTIIDRFNKTQASVLGPEIKVISARDRKLLIGAVGKFYKNCNKHDGRFTRDMIRKNIMGFRNAMCSSRYYRKSSRFIDAEQVK